MFPVRYELNFYILFARNSLFKGLMGMRNELSVYTVTYTE
jgi:hypothetical protein